MTGNDSTDKTIFLTINLECKNFFGIMDLNLQSQIVLSPNHRLSYDELMIKECPFCNIDPKRVIFSNEHAMAIFDAYPVNPGHMLIIPKKHEPDYFPVDLDIKICMLELLHKCRDHLDNEFHPDGYNIGVNVNQAAGQTVAHLHVHIIPRYQGDVEDPRGGVRGVIPEKRNYL